MTQKRDPLVSSKGPNPDHAPMIAAVSPGSRPRFIEETGVKMRWVLIASGCLLQLVNTIIPYPFFAVMLVIAVVYNGSIHWLLRHDWVNFRLLGIVTSTGDILVSIALVYAGGDNDLYLWYFVIFIAHAARFGTAWAMVLTAALGGVYVGGLLARAGRIDPAVLDWHVLFTRVLFMLLATLLCSYLATQERLRFRNLLNQQRELFVVQSQRQRMLEAIKRYVGTEVAADILNERDGIGALGGRRKQVTVLFADIQGFTPLAARLPPEQVVELLNEYFTAVTELVFKHGGALDKFIGDAVVAVFGVPRSRDDDALRAVHTAIAIERELGEVRRTWDARSGSPLQVRVGIDTGWAIVGNVGSPQRMDYTVIGDVVNTASRIQNLAQPGSILVSETTRGFLGDSVLLREFPEVEIRGKEGKPARLFEVVEYRQSPSTSDPDQGIS